ncbi:group II intron reverse transcriptase/maturase [Faecalicoccus pleomorphus]|uniref:Group II intron reverse transcriptase/maturase n=1 Tax=Faecalicoccus pleomorphus TaxID=1323 RepID=A0A7X9RJZ6_9FIRM|nr:group II intron reverse transcriptase/maturase [Faecalicoccus pleomorphus]NME45563.1 group II intron reverse transcriptase/maturase [Faecalicoccus pleomorphus]
METKRQDIRTLSKRYPKLETLMNRVDKESLIRHHRLQKRNKASGIDKVTKEEYEENLEENIDHLINKLKSFKYRPQPVRRVEIDKGNGKKRPLGIPVYEDRLVQGAMAEILKEVYEPRFMDCSYGFRPNRKAHDAIKVINDTIMHKKVNYILDCDIKGFFDNVNHEWLMKFLRNDIADPNYLRYIARMLKSGVMIEGRVEDNSVGTPQGGLISPILANVYLHYVPDLWFEKCIKKQLYGEAYLVRYADDFLIMFQYERDAHRVYEAIAKRMEKFGLELSKEKTQILPFGRNCATRETFDFLGFTHFNGKTRNGYYTVGHKISRKKKKQFKSNLKKWVKENRNLPFDEFMKTLNKKITGSINYYSLNGMMREIKGLCRHAMYVTFKWLNRRSQRKSFQLDTFYKIWQERIVHPHVHVNIWNSTGVTYN